MHPYDRGYNAVDRSAIKRASDERPATTACLMRNKRLALQPTAGKSVANSTAYAHGRRVL